MEASLPQGVDIPAVVIVSADACALVVSLASGHPIGACTHVCIHAQNTTQLRVYLSVCIQVCVYVCLCVCLCVYLCVCVWPLCICAWLAHAWHTCVQPTAKEMCSASR